MPDLGLERREVRTLEPLGLARREGDARRRPLDGNEHVLLDQTLARELDRPHVERVPLRVVDREARVVVGDDASHAGRERAEEGPVFAVRYQRVVHLEQQPEAVAFVREFLLRALRGLVVERVVDRQRNLTAELLEKRDVGRAERVLLVAREVQGAQAAQRRGERNGAERFHPFGAQELGHAGKPRLVVDVGHHHGLLGQHRDPGGRPGGGHLEDGGEDGADGGEGVQPHDIAFGVVQHEPKHVEGGDPLEHAGQVAEQALEVTVRGGGARDLEQGPMDVRAGARAHAARCRGVERVRGLSLQRWKPVLHADSLPIAGVASRSHPPPAVDSDPCR